MLQTIEATIDTDGMVRLSEPVVLGRTRRALVTILDAAEDDIGVHDCALLSEPALAEGWTGEAEDRAWAHLQDLPALTEADE